ncbi:MAG TPA: TlpA disulfide reductase family protein [Opitutaceae bacterium]|nr:TlpA disulfide reductase family protein [Opitutaceae bacterium]
MSWNKCQFLGVLFALAALAPLRAEVKTGEAFPVLASAGLVGQVPATAGKILLVDFWASWCAPCKASFPVYARLQADYAVRGLVIVAVSVDEDPAAYAAFVKKFAPPFVTVRDATQQLVSAVNVPTMPTSYLVGPDGRVRHVHSGFHGEETEQALRTEIEALLAEKSS